MKASPFSERILDFFLHLNPDQKLPAGIQILNPYKDPAAWDLCKRFYKKYYSDNKSRRLILGINPGRFGGGLTGIPFTDPIRLEEECGIVNPLPRKAELSSDFIYRMIRAMGTVEDFYSRFYISSVSPLGFTREGKNLNYYDDPRLQKKITPFVLQSLRRQLEFDVRTDICYCLGEDKNFKFLTHLNQQHHFFDQIIPLPHPRFIMQYRRKKIKEYIERYQSGFGLTKD